jgi:hypothetical protein
MSETRPSLIAVDGANGGAVLDEARRIVARLGGRGLRRVSRFDASGLFDQMVIAGEQAGEPSPRTLLLLYAADLAFRLKWEIRPALADGKSVVAAPYVDTAVAFGRAAGLRSGWLANLFQFAMRPAECHYVDLLLSRTAARKGFIEFGCSRLGGRHLGFDKKELIARTRAQLATAAVRARRRAHAEIREARVGTT